MSVLDWFSAGPKAAEKVLDAGIRGIDALVFTDEERAAMRKELGAQWVELQKALGEESSIRSVTRRIIAVSVMFAFILLVIGAAVAYPWMPEYSKFLLDLAEGQFGWIVFGVGGFYFGPHMLGRMGLGKSK